MHFEASLENLRSILQWILDELKGVGFDRDSLNKIELASEEAIVNVYKHGYKGRAEKIEIEVKRLPKKCEIVIKDHGPPFNPLKWKGVDITSPLDEREIGGLGIYFIRNSMDGVRYARIKNQNVLTLVKSIHSSSQKR